MAEDAITALLGGVDRPCRCLAVVAGPGPGAGLLLEQLVEDVEPDRRVIVLRGHGAGDGGTWSGVRELLAGLGSIWHGEPAGLRRLRRSLSAASRYGADGSAVVAADLAVELDHVGTRHRLVVVVPEWGRLDERSRAALAAAGPRVGSRSVVLLAAGTPDRPGPTWPSVTIDPQPTPGEDGAGPAHDLTPDARDRVRRESGGDPLVARELARALARTDEPGAELLRRLLPLTPALVAEIGRPVRALGRPTQLALAVAAEHLGDDVATVLDATGLVLGDPVGLDVLQVAADAGLVDLTPARVRFGDLLVRAAAACSVGHAVRRDVHDALSAVVTDRPHDVAWHRAHVVDGPDEAVAAALEASAAAAGPRDDAVAVLRRQELAARLSTEPMTRTRRRLAAVTTCDEIGRPDVGDALLRRAEAAAGPDAEAQDAVATVRLARAARSVERRPGGRGVPDAWRDARAAWRLGRTGEATAHLDEAASCFRAAGRRALLGHARALRAQLAAVLGDWDVALSAADEVLDLAGTDARARARAHGARALVHAYRGDETGSRRERHALESLADRGADLLAPGRLARGVGELQGAAWDDAVATLRSVVDGSARDGDAEIAAAALTHLAEAAARAGRTGEVDAALAGLPAAGALPPVLATAAACARALTVDGALAEDALAAALAAVPRHWTFLRARVAFALGVRLRRLHRPADGRRVLVDADEVFDRAGACWWSAAVRGELHLDRAVPGDAGGIADVLSAQELRIARLVADGLSNREVGRRLMLSPRTVGCYLYRMFPRLGITSRVQLATRLHDVEAGRGLAG